MFNFIVGVDGHGHYVYQPIPPATETEVQTLESIIRTRLPDAHLPEEYRKFLKTVNGGAVDKRQTEGRPLCMDSRRRDGKVERHTLEWIFTLNKDFLVEKTPSLPPNLDLTDFSTLMYRAKQWVANDWHGEAPNYFTHIPDDIFPIAHASHLWCGNEWLVISINGPHYGKVFVFMFDVEGIYKGDYIGWSDDVLHRPQHERYDPEDYLFHVADNFDEFLAKLYPCPQDDE